MKTIIAALLVAVSLLPVCAQNNDIEVSLDEVIVRENAASSAIKSIPQSIQEVSQSLLQKRLSPSLMQTLKELPGVQSMDIGMGFAKPVIRGMGFDRVVVVENGIKQQGQQWGADHGLEIDAMNVQQLQVIKGAASLRYGSDAMGGAIIIDAPQTPLENGLSGDLALSVASVNDAVGASLALKAKISRWFISSRLSLRQFGDYRIPADTVVYLTRKLPVYKRRLKNTAGQEYDVNLYIRHSGIRNNTSLSISEVYQKMGFFPGAHGIPDIERVTDDGNSRNIEYPYSAVSHLKITASQRFFSERYSIGLTLAYQNNLRGEWSAFHTHYPNQSAPAKDADKELEFNLNSYEAALNGRFLAKEDITLNYGITLQSQGNSIAGYSFLLPEYKKQNAGFYLTGEWHLRPDLSLSGGLRYDRSHIRIDRYDDQNLADYLSQMGYSAEMAAAYSERCYAVSRNFEDFSAAIGLIWNITENDILKFSIGRSFRVPNAVELASNGVHHGTFRHERGDRTLNSEKGWQCDMEYTLTKRWITVSFSPYLALYSNYIYLQPTGEWSVLPHAGQIYAYTQTRAANWGGEITLGLKYGEHLSWQLAGEYLYTLNREENLPLSFTPPASLLQTLNYERRHWDAFLQFQLIADQKRIARNEEVTHGAGICNAGLALHFTCHKMPIDINIAANNLTDRHYYNHLSFYRKIEIPEPGRSFRLQLKINF